MQNQHPQQAQPVTCNAFDKMWQEIDQTDWRSPPYYGMISRVARNRGITRQAGYNAIRRHNVEFGIALLSEKRKLEQSVLAVLIE